MSDYTSPPNSYELYHGQGQGQGYYPSHQESTMPEQKYYNSAPHNQPEFASAAPDYPPPYRGQTPQDYHLGPGSECLPRVSNQDNEYVPYHAEQHQCSGENASYYAGIPQDQVNGVGTVPGVGPERDGERGLGSTFIGGAAGGYAGHKMHGGFLGTAGGADLGAAGMNMVSHEM
ncbi:hypothetical protein N7507_003768 [Penicillium longicatenatum]|nr:hypothetical protein N7507_003768 [Penicillium longicatenatum]